MKAAKTFQIKGHCLVARTIGDRFRDCLVGSDKGAPTADRPSMLWRIRLTPARYLGDLAYSDVDVEVEADVQAGGICSRAGGAGISHTAGSPVPIPVDMCDIVWDYKDQIRNQARDTLRTILQRDDTRRQIADGLRPTLDSLGIGEVTKMRLEGGELVLSHVPLPDDDTSKRLTGAVQAWLTCHEHGKSGSPASCGQPKNENPSSGIPTHNENPAH
ncbi:MAG: hypothetical protein U5P41_08245 [Gammaproteobacteria bacterium]|nr:hypothetical protein [Gammaproteobacteria bacterium]